MKKFFEEFKQFALKGNMFDMAVGIIIGGAFTGVVNSLTDNFINPLLKFLTGAATYSTQELLGYLSSFLSAFLNFIIMAFVLFCLLKVINKIMTLGQKNEKDETPTTKKCPYCMSEIDINAKRCPHCTSVLETEDNAGDNNTAKDSV